MSTPMTTMNDAKVDAAMDENVCRRTWDVLPECCPNYPCSGRIARMDQLDRELLSVLRCSWL